MVVDRDRSRKIVHKQKWRRGEGICPRARKYAQSTRETEATSNYKMTKMVRALSLAERSVCMRVCKHDVSLFAH